MSLPNFDKMHTDLLDIQRMAEARAAEADKYRRALITIAKYTSNNPETFVHKLAAGTVEWLPEGEVSDG